MRLINKTYLWSWQVLPKLSLSKPSCKTQIYSEIWNLSDVQDAQSLLSSWFSPLRSCLGLRFSDWSKPELSPYIHEAQKANKGPLKLFKRILREFVSSQGRLLTSSVTPLWSREETASKYGSPFTAWSEVMFQVSAQFYYNLAEAPLTSSRPENVRECVLKLEQWSCLLFKWAWVTAGSARLKDSHHVCLNSHVLTKFPGEVLMKVLNCVCFGSMFVCSTVDTCITGVAYLRGPAEVLATLSWQLSAAYPRPYDVNLNSHFQARDFC